MEGDARWSLNFLTVLPLLAVVIITMVVITVLLGRWYLDEREVDSAYGEKRFAFWITVGGSLLTLVVVVVTAAGFFPYEKEYHAYVKKVGVVESIDRRLLNQTHKFVVKYTDGREFGCEDTRCALVKPGNTLVLACIRVWQYQGSDGYDCNFVERRA